MLRDRNVKHLVATGGTIGVRIRSAMRDAMYRRYDFVAVAECTAEPIANEHPRTNQDASLLTTQLLFG